MTWCGSRRQSHRGMGGGRRSGKNDTGRFSEMGNRMDDFVNKGKEEFKRHGSSHFDRYRGNRPGRLAGLYRARDGKIFGVCKGLANYFDLSVGWIRFFTVLGFIMTGFWPVGVLYLIATLIMKPAPVITPRNAEEAEFYDSYAESRQRALDRLGRTFDRLERRLRRVEDVVTSREFNWQDKVKN
jgi:phage shock protein C